jgi:hypothetical protein
VSRKLEPRAVKRLDGAGQLVTIVELFPFDTVLVIGTLQIGVHTVCFVLGNAGDQHRRSVWVRGAVEPTKSTAAPIRQWIHRGWIAREEKSTGTSWTYAPVLRLEDDQERIRQGGLFLAWALEEFCGEFNV